MDKNAIKKYAVWARRELISRVSQRAALYEITDKGYGDASADSVLGRVMSTEEKRQRQALIAQIREKGYEQVMEEIAYTWFNRFIALRFMEVNGYLPSRVRVFTDDENNFKPQILTEAINMELDGLDMEKVYALKNANDDDALFKYMIIVQCNALSGILPGMFQHISDFTELLLPDNLLREGSVIEQMVSMIPEEDWTDQVQIIGWLYQYYNTEPKDKVFADLKKNIKITKENIPAATQLFTPDWIVHYMVENSLGRLWLEGHPNDDLKSEWKYYLDEAEQEAGVQIQLTEIHKEYAALNPEEIRVIDPCMGSGHILCVLFDVLVRIYEDYGYTSRDAAVKIVEKNLWGLDIDERAAQLSYFAVTMKARQYDRRFLNRKVQPHVYAIEESNGITSAPMHDMGINLTDIEYAEAVKQAMRLIEEMHDAKEYGSIIRVTPCDWSLLRRFAIPRDSDGQLHLDIHGEIEASRRLQNLIDIAEALSQKYDVVVTNPPYMSAGGMDSKLTDFVKKYFFDTKSDLFAVFMEQCLHLTKARGFQAMITQHSWMFLSSFEKLRSKLLVANTTSMAHLGSRAFEEISGEVVQTTSFVLRNTHIPGYVGVYCRLTEPLSQNAKEEMFLSNQNRYYVTQDVFPKIPGSPIAYWINPHWFDTFEKYPVMRDICVLKKGTSTGDNKRFIRQWQEVDITRTCFDAHSPEEAFTSGKKWFPINGGGERRKWYGNRFDVVNWESDGAEMKALATKLNHGGHWSRYIINPDRFFTESIGWSAISTSRISARYVGYGFAFSSAAMEAFEADLKYIMALINSAAAEDILKLLAPTLNFGVEQIGRIPYIKSRTDEVERLTDECIDISKKDWDSFEISWDFKEHPFITLAHRNTSSGKAVTVKQVFDTWKDVTDKRFLKLKENEEELNRIFIELYGLSDELRQEVDDKDLTIHRADLQREVRSFISYAVGCMFGRYSLGFPGIAYAGGEWDVDKTSDFLPDKDGIIPICDDDYFEDDIVGRFVKFVEVVYGVGTLEDNLRFIADALGGKGSSREVIRSYFINDFYADHVKVYQKRPIYWLFDSGKKNGFKCLIYMHRYQPDTIARIRTDYVHEQQSRYRTAIADFEGRVANAGTSERVKLTKQLTKLQEQAEELRAYEEKIHHLADQMIRIDLDDGVKHNYAIFQDVLAKIK
jgi:hypothetical protein